MIVDPSSHYGKWTEWDESKSGLTWFLTSPTSPPFWNQLMLKMSMDMYHKVLFIEFDLIQPVLLICISAAQFWKIITISLISSLPCLVELCGLSNIKKQDK